MLNERTEWVIDQLVWAENYQDHEQVDRWREEYEKECDKLWDEGKFEEWNEADDCLTRSRNYAELNKRGID